MSAQPAATVLAYHRIATPAMRPELAPTLIDAYPDAFEAQMRYLAARYNVISSWDLVRALCEGHTLPRRAIIITFDDGYRCFQEIAWPILRRLGLPVTLFVPTYYPSHPGALFWWDSLHRALMLTREKSLSFEIRNSKSEIHEKVPLEAIRERETAFERLVPIIERLGEGEAKALLDAVLDQCAVTPDSAPHMLNWSEIAELAAEGVSVGPHTRNHSILAQLSPARAYDEVASSWSDLRHHIPKPLPIFCYPNGQPYAINGAAVDAVRRSGLVGAFTMVAGRNRVGRTDPYLMYRVGAVAGETLRRFSVKIMAAGQLYRRLRRLARRRLDALPS